MCTSTAHALPHNPTYTDSHLVQGGEMGHGQVLQFPGWAELRAMPAESLKAWLLSKQGESTAQYDAVVASEAVPSHRGLGAVRPEVQRLARHQGDDDVNNNGTVALP